MEIIRGIDSSTNSDITACPAVSSGSCLDGCPYCQLDVPCFDFDVCLVKICIDCIINCVCPINY